MLEVKLQGIRKCYGDKLILNLPETRFAAGSISALLGKNGVGKSTLLGIIADLDHHYEGTVLFNGQKRDSSFDRQVVLVRQPSYLFHRSVQENIAYPLDVRGVRGPQRDQRIAELLRNFGIEAIRHQKAHTLSGGEAQKVALARALAASPQLLLLDETTASIHEETLRTIEQQLLDYHAQSGCTIVFVTHDQAQARRLAQVSLTIEAAS